MRSRGLEITDDALARHYLGKISYYRLSAYCYPFRQRAVAADGTTTVLDDFQPGVSFNLVHDLYVFDKRLRLLCLDALERIEIALRADIAIQLGQIDPVAHRDPATFHGHFSRRRRHPGAQTKHEKLLEILDDKASRSTEDFAKHFRAKYAGCDMPIWVASELLDFGGISHVYSGLTFADRTVIAAHYGVNDYEMFGTWIRCLNDVRNNCAHHSRLWNKPQVNQPQWPAVGVIPEFDHLSADTRAQTRLYSALLIMRKMLRVVSPNSTWALALIEHLGSFPDNPYVSLQNAGFPQNWENLPAWQ